MGTYYRVILGDVTQTQARDAQKIITAVLDRINHSMSVFDPLSEVSRFNLIQSDTKFCASHDFAEVMRTSFKAYELTKGAFDPSLGPVIDLWGFGVKKADMDLPRESDVSEALEAVGLDKIHMDKQGCLFKSHPETRLNLSAIAKGYGVDAIAQALRDMNITSFLVDIGGDIYAGSPRPDKSPWKVGISTPHPQAGADDLMEILELEKQALATSGDYRNFFIKNGQRYSHIIDPSTGQPVRKKNVSATVKAETCVLADALATSMLVMGPDKSLALAKESSLFEVMLIFVNEDSQISVRTSPGFFSRDD